MSSKLVLCDCPGIVFPRLDVSLPMQVGRMDQQLLQYGSADMFVAGTIKLCLHSRGI
jgi:hypothetical protein